MEPNDPSQHSGIHAKDNATIHANRDVVGGNLNIGRDQINVNVIPPVYILVMLIAAVVVVIAVLLIFGKLLVPALSPQTPMPAASAIPACITEQDIIVTFRVFENKTEIASLSSGDTVALEPDATVQLQPEVVSVTNANLPPLEFHWTNVGVATEGKLLHQTGSHIDYRSGHNVITDAVSMQPSQPSCEALAPYHFFVTAKSAATPKP